MRIIADQLLVDILAVQGQLIVQDPSPLVTVLRPSEIEIMVTLTAAIVDLLVRIVTVDIKAPNH